MYKHLQKYATVGVVNTILTLSVIFVLLKLNLSIAVANASGYAAGIANSYLMNKRFTFGIRRQHRLVFPFILAFALSYSLNLAVVFLIGGWFYSKSLLPHIAGMIVYNAFFFLLMKIWVFSQNGAN